MLRTVQGNRDIVTRKPTPNPNFIVVAFPFYFKFGFVFCHQKIQRLNRTRLRLSETDVVYP